MQLSNFIFFSIYMFDSYIAQQRKLRCTRSFCKGDNSHFILFTEIVFR